MKATKIYIIIGLLIILTAVWLRLKDHSKFRLAQEAIKKPIGQIIADYAQRSCLQFSSTEQQQGYFEALVTGYCRPQSALFANRQDFLCAVGLNCSCPNGRSNELNCQGKNGLAWSACLEFDDQAGDYCHQTALQLKPRSGFIAADWQCFPPSSTVNIGGQDFIVADKGSAITGRRFDLWFDDCRQALNAIGIYKVSLPKNYER